MTHESGYQVAKPDWVSEDRFKLDGVEFLFTIQDFKARSDPERLVLLKPRSFIDGYLDLIERLRARRVVEFGIWEGGSAMFLTIAGRLERLVGFDLKRAPEDIQVILGKPLGAHVSLHYQTSQDNREAVRQIIHEEFGDEPLDLIVDDASHLYGPSKAAFEASFGFLRPGGVYAIEDWGWSHWRNWVEPESWRPQPALSNLLVEIMLSIASGSQAIAGLTIISGSLAHVTRGHGLAHGAEFDLAKSLSTRRQFGPM